MDPTDAASPSAQASWLRAANVPMQRKMRVFTVHWLTAAALAAAALQADAATPEWEARQAATAAFVHDRKADVRHLLLGPARPDPAPVAPNQTCAELYARRVALMRTQYDYKPAYTDDPRNRAAIFIGTIFAPAFYYLAFTGIQSYTESTRAAQTDVDLEALRYASALQHCYVR